MSRMRLRKKRRKTGKKFKINLKNIPIYITVLTPLAFVVQNFYSLDKRVDLNSNNSSINSQRIDALEKKIDSSNQLQDQNFQHFEDEMNQKLDENQKQIIELIKRDK